MMPDPAIAERAAIKTAIETATTAVNEVDNDSDAAEVKAADDAIAAAKAAIAAAANVPAEEKAANTGTVTALETQLASAKSARMMAMDDARKAADAAMMATAMKLHAGIGDDPLAAARVGAYGTGNDANKISVTTGADGVAAQLLSATKMMVAANHGWEGKQYTASGTGVTGTYEAMVYSNVGEPEEGEKFNVQYTLTDGAVAVDTTGTDIAGRVASSHFDQSAGLKRFKLPDPNPSGATMITVAGSYHGVSGTYSCTPGAVTCAVNVAASGFQLGTVATDGTFTDGGGAWMFTPTDPNAKVTSTPDTAYASYGWWLHTAEDGALTASAFMADKGTVAAASGITALRGTATYMGGAAGKYALYSSTGGTNDAGHFTARARLEADFNADTITGTIDQFMGADGMSRDWSVALQKSGISDIGAIAGDGTDGNTDLQKTVWTRGGTAAAAAGQWSGSLKDNGDDGVPKVGTGTFHSMYSTGGRMVGAFGVTKQ